MPARKGRRGRPSRSRPQPAPLPVSRVVLPTSERIPCTCALSSGRLSPVCPVCAAWEKGLVLCVDGRAVGKKVWVETFLVHEKEVQ